MGIYLRILDQIALRALQGGQIHSRILDWIALWALRGVRSTREFSTGSHFGPSGGADPLKNSRLDRTLGPQGGQIHSRILDLIALWALRGVRSAREFLTGSHFGPSGGSDPLENSRLNCNSAPAGPCLQDQIHSRIL